MHMLQNRANLRLCGSNRVWSSEQRTNRGVRHLSSAWLAYTLCGAFPSRQQFKGLFRQHAHDREWPRGASGQPMSTSWFSHSSSSAHSMYKTGLVVRKIVRHWLCGFPDDVCIVSSLVYSASMHHPHVIFSVQTRLSNYVRGRGG